MAHIKPVTVESSTKDTLFDIYKSLSPIYITSKISGLFPSDFQNTATGTKIIVMKSDWIYFLLYFFLSIVLGLSSIISSITNNNNLNSTYDVITVMKICVIILLMVLIIISTFMMRKNLANSLIFLADIDKIFIKNGFKIDSRGLLKFNYIIIIVMLSILITKSILMLTAINVDVIVHITLPFAELIKSLTICQVISFVSQLLIRFQLINNGIKSFYKEQKSKILNFEVKNVKSELYILCRLHYKLGNVLRSINRCFAFQMLVTIAVTLLDVLYQVYCLYYILMRNKTLISFATISYPLISLIGQILELYCLVYSCSSTCDDANETPTILHKYRNSSYSTELETQIQVHSLQMLHQTVEFSALGFFSIDFTLLYSLVGAVATYLVIFIQFDQASTSSVETKTISPK